MGLGGGLRQCLNGIVWECMVEEEGLLALDYVGCNFSIVVLSVSWDAQSFDWYGVEIRLAINKSKGLPVYPICFLIQVSIETQLIW